MDYSIVMSIYKNDKLDWVIEALNSLLLQSLPAKEILIGLDGPVDQGITDFLISVIESNKSVRVFQFEINAGLGFIRNFAISKCESAYVGLMDADDISVFDRFHLQAKAIQDNNADFVGGFISEFDASAKSGDKVRRVPVSLDEVNSSWLRQPFNHVTLFFKRKAFLDLGGYNTDHQVEDFELFLRAKRRGWRFQNIPIVLVNVRFNSDTIRRRRGWVYLTHWINIYNLMLAHREITTFHWVLAVFVHSVAKLGPKAFSKLLYRLSRS